MTASQDDSYESLARYASGEATAEERASAERQLAADPGMARLLGLVGPSLERLQSTDDIDTEAALNAVHTRMHEERDVVSLEAARATRASREQPAVRASRASMMRAAAAIIVIAGGLGVWKMMSHTASVPAATYATTIGESRDVKLTDGSTVHLGPASTMTVQAGAREVRLDGIAQFTVQHDAAHPFKVHADGAIVEDVGTVFTVRTDGNGVVGVAVSEGSVKLRASAVDGSVSTVLRAGDRGMIAAGSVRAEPGKATAADVSWTKDVLTFEDAPLTRVGTDLHRWFGVEAVIDSSVSTRHLTATFDHEPIEQIMRTIGLALDAQVDRRGDTVFIGGRR